MSEKKPSPTADNGRDSRGRFKPGNRLAEGNPFARRAQKLRAALFGAVTPDDLKEIITTLVRLARAGDVQAAKLVMDRLLGPPTELDLLLRLEKIEELMELRK